MVKMNGRYDGQDVRYVDSKGKAVRAADEDFEQLARMWEHDGLDIDLVYMARPLLEGTGKQQTLASRLLQRVRDEWMTDAQAQTRLLALLKSESLSAGRPQHQTEDAYIEEWEDMSGPAKGKGLGDMSFGHSEATQRASMRAEREREAE